MCVCSCYGSAPMVQSPYVIIPEVKTLPRAHHAPCCWFLLKTRCLLVRSILMASSCLARCLCWTFVAPSHKRPDQSMSSLPQGNVTWFQMMASELMQLCKCHVVIPVNNLDYILTAGRSCRDLSLLSPMHLIGPPANLSSPAWSQSSW